MSSYGAILACLWLVAHPEESAAGAVGGQRFPGFVAVLEIDWNGRSSQGRIIVDGEGRVYLEPGPPAPHAVAVEKILALVQQRLAKPRLHRGESWRSPERTDIREITRPSWRRVGSLDLPAAIEILGPGQAGRIVLSGHRLLDESEGR